MAEARKPNYFFSPDAIEDEENCHEAMAQEQAFAEEGEVCEVDFEESQARRWTGDPFEC